MTTPTPILEAEDQRLKAEGVAEAKPRSRKMYILWAIALALLLSLGAFCWLVVVPVMNISRVVHYETMSLPEPKDPTLNDFADLGGRRKALGQLSIYLRMPTWIAKEKARALWLAALCGRKQVHRSFLNKDGEPCGEVVPGERTLCAEEAVAVLATMVDDPDRNTRFTAMQGMDWIAIKTEACLKALKKATRDSDDTLGLVARRALEKIERERKQ